MQTIAIGNLFVFIIVAAIGTFVGMDLRKGRSWLFGLYGLLSGVLLGLGYGTFEGGLLLGALFAFAVMFGGATTRWHRQRFK